MEKLEKNVDVAGRGKSIAGVGVAANTAAAMVAKSSSEATALIANPCRLLAVLSRPLPPAQHTLRRTSEYPVQLGTSRSSSVNRKKMLYSFQLAQPFRSCSQFALLFRFPNPRAPLSQQPVVQPHRFPDLPLNSHSQKDPLCPLLLSWVDHPYLSHLSPGRCVAPNMLYSTHTQVILHNHSHALLQCTGIARERDYRCQ